MRNDFKGELFREDFPLKNELWDEIECWLKRYVKIIPLSLYERKMEKEEIDQLDKQGINIKEKIAQLLGEDIKIRYYSEVYFKHIDG